MVKFGCFCVSQEEDIIMLEKEEEEKEKEKEREKGKTSEDIIKDLKVQLK